MNTFVTFKIGLQNNDDDDPKHTTRCRSANIDSHLSYRRDAFISGASFFFNSAAFHHKRGHIFRPTARADDNPTGEEVQLRPMDEAVRGQITDEPE